MLIKVQDSFTKRIRLVNTDYIISVSDKMHIKEEAGEEKVMMLTLSNAPQMSVIGSVEEFAKFLEENVYGNV